MTSSSQRSGSKLRRPARCAGTWRRTSGPLCGDVAQNFGTQATLLCVAAKRLTGQPVGGIVV
ncbi:hypothetical protein [Sulfitobacter sp. 1A12779]|uniref:hypothetical protein n=1 Tax=Sulfitobacter sp. 1A12779 TaxID=3368599 RepID=UPI0037463B61